MSNSEKKRVYRPLKSQQSVKNQMAMYYFQSKNPYLYDEGKKVAWVTSGGPVEFLIAMDIIPLYPEQYGAIAGAAKESTRLCQVAEAHGYGPDLCAYARTSFGSIFSPEPPTPMSEINGTGGLAKPDMLICGNNICGTVLKWYQDLSRIFNIPLFLFDTPPLGDSIPNYYIDYLADQLQHFITFLEKQMGRKLDDEKIDETMRNSLKAVDLWTEILELGKEKPSPLNCADRFLLMAPVVAQRGKPETLSIYQEVLTETQDRVDNDLGAITIPEKYRLLWDNIPIWFNLYEFFNSLAAKGVVFPVDTYTQAWSQGYKLKDSGDLLRDAAVLYSNIYLNKTLQHKIDLISRLSIEYNCEGILYHSMRSCKRYSLGQPVTRREVTEKTSLPGVSIEGDMCDSRNFSDEQAWTRIEALLEIIDLQ
ncbi:MAG: 2-hydroxyacyl-CoA dehydratase subunit D [Candidatus Hodarchaeales archaeon]|jgi:benzoyl-CoA reductase/2-hydroxyglutaryl-CoA dehydratase subunit BcrC/BadD/HgdB